MSNRYAHLNSSAAAGAAAAALSHGGPCDAPVIHSGCSATLLSRISDRNAYGAVVADACEFNRGLSRGRASRLPFVDLATRTTQRPAPWLYRPQCDRFKETIDGGTHVVLRYLRHRWRLDSPPLSRRRKSAADRLWYTLQTGLNALGVPTDLIPLVTKRAYAIAGLPIPAVLAANLDLSKQGAGQLVNGASINTGSSVLLTGRTATYNSNTSVSKRFSNIADLPSVDCVRKTQPARGEEEPDLVNEEHTSGAATEDVDIPLKSTQTRSRPSDDVTAIISGEDSGQSNEASLPKRGAHHRTQSTMGVEEENKTDDETSGQSGSGTKLNANSDGSSQQASFVPPTAGRAVSKTYGLEPEPETEDDDEEEEQQQPGDEDYDQEDDEEEEQDDFDEELDDVEWIQSGRRRSGRSGFSARRAFHISRSQRSLTAHKGGRLTIASNRLSGRHVSTAPRSLGVRQKPRTSRSDLATMTSTGGRRATRSAVTGPGSKALPVTPSGGAVGADKQNTESWDRMDEPGFQPNANLSSLTADRVDDQHRLLTDQLCGSNHVYSSSNNLPMVQALSGTETVPLLCDPSSRGSPASFADQVRRHVQTAISGVPTCSAYQPTSAPQPTNSAQLQSKSPTMAQLLASSTAASSSASVNYNYHGVISSESSARDVELHTQTVNSDWSGSPSSASQSSSKLLKDNVSGSITATRSVLDYPAAVAAGDQSSPSRTVTTTGDQFATPAAGATTTVTFFVCEVCASRYRSTAGLRYHYHSQHSGYTPKNPISASASRLVVPVGEERGIGGGLRGGRPRRNKGGNLDVRGRSKMKDVDLKTYVDTNLVPGNVRGGMSEPSAGVDNVDAFKEPNVLQSSSSSADPCSTFSPNYLSSNGAVRIPGEPSPNRSFMRSVNYSPKHPLGSNGLMDEGLKTGQLTSGGITTPLTSMGLMASGFTQLPGNPGSATTDGSSLVELNRSVTPQRLHQLHATSSAVEITGNLARSQTPSNSPLATVGPPISYGNMPWTGPDHPYGPPPQPGPTSSQPGSSDVLAANVGTYSYCTPEQRRYERQHCADRVSPGRVPVRSGDPHCVYCLGNDRLNPRLGRAENLLRCYRCAQWAHFSCLRLPPHVIETALRYPWQCILCKTCWLCGSPEQELRMIFCGDCDRAFHIDCLPAPLKRIPDGSWSCDICLHEIYAMGKSTDDSNSNGGNSNNKFSTATDSYYLLKDH